MLFQPIVYGLIFIGVYLMLGGLYLLAFGKQMKRDKKVNRRLALLQEGRDTEEVLGRPDTLSLPRATSLARLLSPYL